MDSNCRTCSRHDEFRGVSLDSLSERHQEPIYMMLVYCTQLQISTSDTLPQQICPNCLIMLDRAFAFWQQCRFSDANFRWAPSETATTTVDPEPQPESPVVVVEARAVTPPPPTKIPAEPTPQRYWCCFRKCPEVRDSLGEMEEHAKEVHSAKRIGYEKLRLPEHEYVCTICRAGFDSLGKFEFHRTIQLGVREKHVEESNQEIYRSVKDVLNGITNDLKDKFEAKARTRKDDFLIYMRKKDYETVRSTKTTRSVFMKRINTFAQKVCQKSVRLILICNSCRFETNVSQEMQRHAKKEPCQNATCSYALKTYAMSITIYKCIQCGYETPRKERFMNHQVKLSHEGIEIIRPPPQDDGNDSITIKNEPAPFSDDEDESMGVPPDSGESHKEAIEGHEEPGDSFDCTHCGMILGSDEDKQRHLLYECTILHDKTARYTCEHCKTVTTKTVIGLKKHMRTECPALKGKPRKFTPKSCPKCGSTFNTSEGLARHTIFCSMDHASEALSCPRCNRLFSKKYHLERHLKLQSCVKSSHRCNYCRTTFPDGLALKRHRKVGCPALLNPERFGLKTSCTCPRCGKKLPSKHALKRHEIVDFCRDEQTLTVAPPAGKYQCPHCRMNLASLKVLQTHLVRHCLVLLQRQAEEERNRADVADETEMQNVAAINRASPDQQPVGDSAEMAGMD